ncbi:hypothetical protein C5167_007165 [Papaver somniferum]|uniref:Uncharacterized protein n=1 Tax=Papaver somniferum TaxID=3469 RepID=A0A4Y7JJM4_PAPSO|nr:transcription factor MYB64-like [Papaver somniferum]RZC59865.1 hypothetical protein C5167_007165 [Papaver somniferum]
MAEAEIEIPYCSENKESNMSEEEEAKRRIGPVRCRKGGWTAEEDDYLRRSVEAYRGQNWKIIASGLPDKTAVQCLNRWKKVLNPNVNKGTWTPEEDRKLIELVSEYGPIKWSVVEKSMPGRMGKQCRERWFNYLDPTIKKDAWTEYEKLAIVKAQQIYGNQWVEIAKLLPGRTENAIKCLWKCSLKNKLDFYLSAEQFPPDLKTGEDKGLNASAESCLGNENSIRNLCNAPLQKNLDTHLSTERLPSFGSVLTTGEDNAILDSDLSTEQSPSVGSVLNMRGDYAKKTKSLVVGNSAVCNDKGFSAATRSCLGNGDTVKNPWNNSLMENFGFHLSTGQLPPADTILKTEDYALQISISPVAGKMNGRNNEGFYAGTQCSLGNEDFYNVDENHMDLVEPSTPEFLDTEDPAGVLATDSSNSLGRGCRQLASEHGFGRSNSKSNLVKYRSIADIERSIVGTPSPISVPVTGSFNQETSGLTSVSSSTVCVPPACINNLVSQRVKSVLKDAAQNFSNLPSILSKRKRQATGTRNRNEHIKQVQDEESSHSLELEKADNSKEKPASMVVNLENQNTSCHENSTIRLFYTRKAYGLRQN